MQGVDMQPNIKVCRKETHPVVLICGDPARAELIASLCEKSREIAYNREYRTFDCRHQNQDFLVTSHGVGSAGASVCIEETIANGAKIIVRVGTAGTLQPETIKLGDIVVCHSAVREEGATRLFAPKGFPAIADPYVYHTMQDVATAKSKEIKYGMALSTSQFYKSPVLPSSLETFSKARVDIVEMEMSALFVIARIRGVKAGGVCVVDDCPLPWSPFDSEQATKRRAEGKTLMLELALDIAVRLTLDKNW